MGDGVNFERRGHRPINEDEFVREDVSDAVLEAQRAEAARIAEAGQPWSQTKVNFASIASDRVAEEVVARAIADARGEVATGVVSVDRVPYASASDVGGAALKLEPMSGFETMP